LRLVDGPGGPIAERLQELHADRRHAASFLVRRAAEALVEVAEAPAASEDVLERVTSAGGQLAEARPGVAAVAGAVGPLLEAARAWGAQTQRRTESCRFPGRSNKCTPRVDVVAA